jgi:zinc transporter ZupT
MDTRKPTFLQALAFLVCGGLMVFFGCLGALGGALESRGSGPVPGLLVLLAGFTLFVWGIVMLFRWLGRQQEKPDPS